MNALTLVLKQNNGSEKLLNEQLKKKLAIFICHRKVGS